MFFSVKVFLKFLFFNKNWNFNKIIHSSQYLKLHFFLHKPDQTKPTNWSFQIKIKHLIPRKLINRKKWQKDKQFGKYIARNKIQ